MSECEVTASIYESSFKKLAKKNRELIHLLANTLAPNEALFGKGTAKEKPVWINEGIWVVLGKICREVGLSKSFMINGILKMWISEYLHDKEDIDLSSSAMSYCLLTLQQRTHLGTEAVSCTISEAELYSMRRCAKRLYVSDERILRKSLAAFCAATEKIGKK